MQMYLISRVKQVVFPNLLKSEDLHCILRHKNIDVGHQTIFYSPGRTIIDTSRPALLKIGDYCKITSGVIILTHDYSRSVLRRAYGDIIGEGRETIIGDNVFIGMNSIILMGSKIGSNVIIGAGSVVSGEIPDNVVVAGNPAKMIRSLDEHYIIMKNRMLKEAESYYHLFKMKYGKEPTIKEMDPFYPVFLERDPESLTKNSINMKLGGDNEIEVLSSFLSSEPTFKNYQDFIEHCRSLYND